LVLMKPAKIDTVEGLKDQVAEAYAEGATQEQIAELAGVKDRGTVGEWLKREDVQLLVSKHIQDRSNRILRHTDTKIEKKLQADADDKMSLEKLLKVRQTFAGREIKFDLTGDKSQVLQDFLKDMDENPELAAAAAEALANDDPD
jgi:transcriptional regulator with XRE-family HTH domain